MALLGEVVVEHLTEIGLVFDDKHPGHGQPCRGVVVRMLDDRVTVA
jgi:hypothetical protein